MRDKAAASARDALLVAIGRYARAYRPGATNPEWGTVEDALDRYSQVGRG